MHDPTGLSREQRSLSDWLQLAKSRDSLQLDIFRAENKWCEWSFYPAILWLFGDFVHSNMTFK